MTLVTTQIYNSQPYKYDKLQEFFTTKLISQGIL